MVYYKKNGECVNLNCSVSEFNKGTQGGIYRIVDDSSVCLKVYVNDDTSKTVFDDCGKRFTQEMFDYFKDEFDYSNFCKLYDLLYDEKLVTVMAYTMKYYEESVDNMLFLPISYILDNFSSIYDAIEKLTKDCIRVVDLNCDNIINTSNGYVVIDNDKYYKDLNSDVDTLDYINKSALMYTFKGIFEKCLKKHGIDLNRNLELKRIISNLFTINTSPVVLKSKLCNYSKPIDLFYSGNNIR